MAGARRLSAGCGGTGGVGRGGVRQGRTQVGLCSLRLERALQCGLQLRLSLQRALEHDLVKARMVRVGVWARARLRVLGRVGAFERDLLRL